MTITVVIPTLNEERMLPFILRHVAGLGFDEIVVVDGGSTDLSRKVVEDFMCDERTSVSVDRTALVLVTAPPGRGSQMNAGAAASHSDVLLFLHADTSLPVDARVAIEQALRDSGCLAGRFDVRFDTDTLLSRLIGRLMNWRSRWTGIATGDQAVFVRRTVFERLGGFADIPIMEDIDFSRRLKRLGRIAALNRSVVTSYRRWTSGGAVRTIMLMWALRFLYWAGISPHRLHHLYGTIR
jgi:rSAM/selenodomain-associated transferase 2